MNLTPGPIARQTIICALEHSELTADDLAGKSREQGICRTRHAIWLALSRKRIGVRYIAKLFGRERSTVAHGLKRARDLLEIDRDFRELYEKISKP